jgi:hypothetical protein
MKNYLFIFSLFFIVGISSLLAQCTINVANIYSFTQGVKTYEIVKENRNWVNANACAIARNGALAKIDNQAEQDTIFYYLNQAGITSSNTTAPDGGGAAYVWLGGNDRITEGAWFWEDANFTGSKQFWQGARSGSVSNNLYNNWGNEPDNFQNQDALGIALTSWPFGTAGQWNDIDEANALYFIIEIDNTLGITATNVAQTVIKVGPNPVVEKFQIMRNSVIKVGAEMILFDINGKKVKSYTYQSSGLYDAEELKSGNYFLAIEGVDEKIKLIKM